MPKFKFKLALKPRRRFTPLYVVLLLVTGSALATSSAMAANLLPDNSTSALALIIPVIILMLLLVGEVWRETAKNAKPLLERQIAEAQQKRLNH
ncbi:hypothetical protein MNBD_ALPHA12-2023 [hydrothermal vent metagenome]|uniref:Uncharacterized protein n=1 Tax=hydrothermal vent metagenome TaxID=652676 RepID=A0A3B0TPY5_9ZZZZ